MRTCEIQSYSCRKAGRDAKFKHEASEGTLEVGSVSSSVKVVEV